MLAKRIRDLRKKRGYSQAQLANKLGVTQGAVSQWETGATVPAADQLVAIADVFGISVDDLLERTPEQDQDNSWELRERLRRDPDMRMLFSAAENAAPEHLRAAAAMLKALEPPTFPEDDPADEMP